MTFIKNSPPKSLLTKNIPDIINNNIINKKSVNKSFDQDLRSQFVTSINTMNDQEGSEQKGFETILNKKLKMKYEIQDTPAHIQKMLNAGYRNMTPQQKFQIDSSNLGQNFC